MLSQSCLPPPQVTQFAGWFLMGYFITILITLCLGSSPVEHRRRRYSLDEGNWMWWYRPSLPYTFSYLAKGIGLWKILYFKCCQVCDVYGVTHVSNAHILVMMMQRQPLEFFGTIQARQLARDLFITYARYVPLNHFSKGKTVCHGYVILRFSNS